MWCVSFFDICSLSSSVNDVWVDNRFLETNKNLKKKKRKIANPPLVGWLKIVKKKMGPHF